ncbi:molybdenum cofactor synthesis domain-containing protein [Aquipuribacter hungaricus]|uniref:Molybdenum cofactor biosynthesis protein B n=1 Tax=Aquipuribacter hungaricus TaxID=545624 RepID=A0ABV7WEL5_9MICO
MPGRPELTSGTARVVTVSTSAAAGWAADRSGPVLVDGLRALGLHTPDPVVVADGDAVGRALRACLREDVDVVLLTGGTGLTADDTTPEQVLPLLGTLVPGIPEALRADGVRRGVATAVLSRGIAGVAGRTLVVTLPGSTGACRDALEVLGPLLPHVLRMLAGTTAHPHGRGEA